MVFGVIDEVVATMVLWNMVFLASPYLNDVRSGVGEGLVRVWFVRSVVFFQILAFGVTIIRSSCLAFHIAILTSSFDL